MSKIFDIFDMFEMCVSHIDGILVMFDMFEMLCVFDIDGISVIYMSKISDISAFLKSYAFSNSYFKMLYNFGKAMHVQKAMHLRYL